MAVTTRGFPENETRIYIYLTQVMGLHTAAACGVLANMERESSFNPSIYGAYVTRNGRTDNAYGICQWIFGRKDKLISLYGKNASLESQLKFLSWEIVNNKNQGTKAYNSIMSRPNTAQGAYDSAMDWADIFEVFSNVKQSTEAKTRASNARDKFYPYYSVNANASGTSLVPNIGQAIVDVAKDKVGKPWSQKGAGPDSFNTPGFIEYCFKEGGYTGISSSDALSSMSTSEVREWFIGKGATYVDNNVTSTADILFWEKDSPSLSIAIADGTGGYIACDSSSAKVHTSDTLNDPEYIVRALSASELGVSAGTNNPDEPSIASEDYIEITSVDPYSLVAAQTINEVAESGYTYGYLVDLDHGGSFKFYLPDEFSESAGVEWSTIDIRGRSVQVLAYDHTASRKISISLDLYAGVGVYKASGEGRSAGLDSVSKMHSDAYFLKSLEYPDYTYPILRPPATVLLILGSAVNITGVVSDVNIQHLKPHDEYRRSMYMKVSFTVTQTATNPPDWSDIRKESNQVVPSSDDTVTLSSPEPESSTILNEIETEDNSDSEE